MDIGVSAKRAFVEQRGFCRGRLDLEPHGCAYNWSVYDVVESEFGCTGTPRIVCRQGAKSNVAMSLDEANHRLFVSTREPGKLIVLNSDTGKVIADLPAVAMVDDMVYDPKGKRVYLAGDGNVDVFEQKDADHYALLAKVPGSFRAKTGILVPDLNRYYLAVPHHAGKDAEVRVYEVQQ